jgi:ring-1,2-phenylacetyl-CoA epoxidase subunit PaaC
MTLSPGAVEWLLAFADDEHMMGARHASWIGLGPFLEEDLAFCSIAQDELGHAIALYDYLTDDLDRFALLRQPGEYRSSWLSELPCQRWDEALVRHWLYDRAEALRWGSVAHSSVPGLAQLAARAEREESFHREHAEMFLSRIACGDDAGRAMISAALEGMLPQALALWEPVAGEAEAVADGVTDATSAQLGDRWHGLVSRDLARWGIRVDWPAASVGQNERTVRSAPFAELYASLQEVINIDPSATW